MEPLQVETSEQEVGSVTGRVLYPGGASWHGCWRNSRPHARFRQSSALRTPRAALYTVLLVAPALLGWAAYKVAESINTRNFYTSFASRAAAAAQELAQRVDLMSKGGLVLAAAAFGLTSLPNASLPFFSQLANTTAALTLASHLSFSPVVMASQVPGWLQWAAANVPTGSPPFPGSLLLLSANGSLAPGTPATPFSQPIWQDWPAADETRLGAFFDSASSPANYPYLAVAVSSGLPCATGVQGSSLVFGSPFSVLDVPVRAPGRPAVAAVVHVGWTWVDLLASLGDLATLTLANFDCVLSSAPDGAAYTVHWRGGAAAGWAAGSWHDAAQGGHGFGASFAGAADAPAGGACARFTATFYPTTAAAAAAARATSLAATAGSVAGGLAGVALIVVFYDQAVSRWERRRREARALRALRASLRAATSVDDVLGCGADALLLLAPDACGAAVATLAGRGWRGGGCGARGAAGVGSNWTLWDEEDGGEVAAAAGGEAEAEVEAEVAGSGGKRRRGSEEAVRGEGALPPTRGGAASSAAAAAAARAPVDSAAPRGAARGRGGGLRRAPAAAPYSDWAAADAEHGQPCRHVTLPLYAGGFALGAVVAAAAVALPPGSPAGPLASEATLRELSVALASALAVQRAAAQQRRDLAAALHAGGVSRADAAAPARSPAAAILRAGGGAEGARSRESPPPPVARSPPPLRLSSASAGGGDGPRRGAGPGSRPGSRRASFSAAAVHPSPRASSTCGVDGGGGGGSARPPAPLAAPLLLLLRPADAEAASDAEAAGSLAPQPPCEHLPALRSWSLHCGAAPARAGGASLPALATALLSSLGLGARFRLDPAAVVALVAGARDAMSRPGSGAVFHTWGHAWDVLHATWMILDAGGLLRDGLLTQLDALALLCAALCHDLEHPGNTNAFEQATVSPLATLYNDRSVLENHHAATGWALLRSTGLLASLEPTERAHFRRLFICCILATDMACHKGLLADVEARMATAPAGARFPAAPEDRILLAFFVLHTADLCNPLFPPDVSQRNAANLGAEFSAQAAAERARGLPPSVPVPASERERARGELGFIRHVVQPLYGALAKLAPDTRLPCGALIEANAAAWAAIAGGAYPLTSAGPAN